MADYHLLLSLGKLLRVGLAIASGRYTSASAADRPFSYVVDSTSRPVTLELLSINRRDSKLNVCFI
jgi:hypothetical protein